MTFLNPDYAECVKVFEQQRIQTNNDSKHVLDPDREWGNAE